MVMPNEKQIKEKQTLKLRHPQHQVCAAAEVSGGAKQPAAHVATTEERENTQQARRRAKVRRTAAVMQGAIQYVYNRKRKNGMASVRKCRTDTIKKANRRKASQSNADRRYNRQKTRKVTYKEKT